MASPDVMNSVAIVGANTRSSEPGSNIQLFEPHVPIIRTAAGTHASAVRNAIKIQIIEYIQSQKRGGALTLDRGHGVGSVMPLPRG